MDGEAVSTEKLKTMPLFFQMSNSKLGSDSPPVTVQGIPSLHTEPTSLHSPQYSPSVNGMQRSQPAFQLGPLAAGVLFVYSLKKGKNDIFSMVAHLPSLQLVTELPDSTKGGAKGHVLVRGPNKRGCVVEWVEKASFARLNKLFEISAVERHHETLLTARNLLAVVREPQAYIINILPRKLPKTVVPGKHYILKDLPFYKEVQKADAQKCRALFNDREGRRKEGTLRKAPDKKRSAPSLPAGAPSEEEEEESEVLPLPSVSSGFGRFAGLNHSGPSLSVAGCLALVAEEATSINQPDSPHPDADVARAPCAVALPPMVPAMEENGAESQGLPPCGPSPPALVPVKGPARRRSRPARDLKSGLIGRLQDRFLETIEVSCSSVHDDHPEESEAEMVVENPPAPVVVPDGDSPEATQPTETDRAPDSEEESLSNASSGGNPVDDAACISASAFCYAELEEKLKRIPPGLDVAMPSAKMFEVLVSGLRGMVQQHDLFFNLLRTADYMKAFTSQRRNSEEELRLRLEQAETSLSAARNENEGFRMELAEAKSREETLDARLLEAEDEKALLRGNVRQLRTEVSIKKKQREDLQLRLSAQKEELEAEFAAEREELEADYQKQVDEMYFFGYRCCMKKHGIKRDVHSIPPGEEEKLRGKPAQ
ncbi:hypothetical protein CK203_081587 [Vitis vinifera]|uniref:Uncharacterized protein n=1 Tax=Vitis vinifera TaxID=29760 RepID=A0A438E2L9_VITVI|nr:hypothetical protein CK203_081587 [Vitis vinifera]